MQLQVKSKVMLVHLLIIIPRRIQKQAEETLSMKEMRKVQMKMKRHLVIKKNICTIQMSFLSNIRMQA